MIPRPKPPPKHTWIDDEPGWPEVKLELRCIVRKAWRRWWICVLIGVVLGSASAAWRLNKPVAYRGTVVLRVTEGDYNRYANRNQNTSLRAEIEEISLSRSAILEVMEKHDLDPFMRKADPTFAAQSMREDLNVQLVQNYFSQQRDDDDPYRSARVSITFFHTDPEVAVAVARSLGRNVVLQQTRSREQVAGLEVESASSMVDQLKRAIARTREQQLQTYNNALTLDDEGAATQEFVRASTMRAEIKHLEGALTRARNEYAGLDLRHAFMQEALATQFEIIDDGEAERVRLTHSEHILLTGVIGFIIALMVGVLVVGVFDPRVYDEHTVKRLALRVVGHIP